MGAMISRGVLAPHLLRECETEALVDTGALTLVLPMQVVEQLGLRIRARQVPLGELRTPGRMKMGIGFFPNP